MSCRSVRRVLHVDATALEQADRILLEDHLEGCAKCQRTRAQLARVKQLAHAMPLDPIGPAAHQRAIAKAMLRGSEPEIIEPSRARYFALGGLALAGVAALVIWIATRGDDAPNPQPQQVAIFADAAVAPPQPEPDAYDEPGLVVLDERHPRFVLANGFVAEGTAAIRVAPTTVTVVRGVVRVFASDGKTLVAQIVAGETWTLPEPARVSAQALVDRARRAFDARDCRAAEAHAQAALEAQPTRPQSAEARTLLAECAQAASRLDEAVRHYDAIAARFSDLPAGETALVAAARIELSRGNAKSARARFERYVKRYPRGRFIDDARRQLEGIQP